MSWSVVYCHQQSFSSFLVRSLNKDAQSDSLSLGFVCGDAREGHQGIIIVSSLQFFGSIAGVCEQSHPLKAVLQACQLVQFTI